MAGGEGDISGVSVLVLGVGLEGGLKIVLKYLINPQKKFHFNMKDRFWVLNAHTCQADRLGPT